MSTKPSDETIERVKAKMSPKYDLSTDAGRMRALLAIEGSDKRLRFTDVDGGWWERRLDNGMVVGRHHHFPDDWEPQDMRLINVHGTWSIVEPGPKPVEEMSHDEWWRELGAGAVDQMGRNACLMRLVTEKRAREAMAKRDAELEAMTVKELLIALAKRKEASGG